MSALVRALQVTEMVKMCLGEFIRVDHVIKGQKAKLGDISCCSVHEGGETSKQRESMV